MCNNMDGPRGYYSEWNKPDRKKTNILWFHVIYNLKNSNEQTYQKQTIIGTENK